MVESFDLSNLKKWADGKNLRLSAVIRSVNFELSKAVILDTPVKTGNLRLNFNPSLDIADKTVVDHNSEKTTLGTTVNEVALKKIREVVNYSDGELYYFTNSVDYINKIENGGSKQAPSGMIKKNITRFRDIINKEVARTN